MKSSFFLLSLVLLLAQTADCALQRPKLVVVIAIDQFRADYLTRYESQFLPAIQKNGQLGGFRYLMEKGAYFPYGRYDLLQSVTGPGHMTISTGSYPYQSGIPRNEWYNQETKKPVYCVEDADSPIIGSPNTDPTNGRSPKSLIGSTIGDQLKISENPTAQEHSRVVTLSLKDRAAILMGGHTADLAIWFDFDSFQWTTSKYYLPSGKLPDWLIEFNKGQSPQLEKSQLNKKESTNDLPFSLLATKLTIEAAENIITSLKLGSGKSTDFFAVSFSSHDIIGHHFGPNSPEIEEMTFAEDKAISRFLNTLNKKVPGGLKNVVIALTGDHGVAPNEEWANKIKTPFTVVDEKKTQTELNDFLNEKFGKPDQGSWVVDFTGFNLSFNHSELDSKKIKKSEMEKAAKIFFAQNSNFAHIFTSTEYDSKMLPPGMHERQILHSYYPGRSGDLVLIPKPFVTQKMKTTQNATHTTGYAYDRTVPIIFSGMHIRPGIYATQAEVIDIAPTLTFLAGVLPPSLSEGRVVSEALDLKSSK